MLNNTVQKLHGFLSIVLMAYHTFVYSLNECESKNLIRLLFHISCSPWAKGVHRATPPNSLGPIFSPLDLMKQENILYGGHFVLKYHNKTY